MVDPTHRSLLAVDIAAFSSPARTNPIRLQLRHQLTSVLQQLLARADIEDQHYATSDTGDGLIISVAAHIPMVGLLDPLLPTLRRRLVAYNRGKPDPCQLRVRVALHAGALLADPHPLHGEAVIHTCRLLDSPPVRACLAATSQPVAAIASTWIYEEVIKHAYRRINPACWHRVLAEVKETRAPAWVQVPGDPDAPARALNVTPKSPQPAVVG